MSDGDTSVAALRQIVADFVRERDWEQFHDAKNLSMSIAIEAAELMEHFQWTRSEDLGKHLSDPEVQSEVRDELADVVCFVLALANRLEIDLTTAVTEKMKKNRAKYPAEAFRGRWRAEEGNTEQGTGNREDGAGRA